MIAQMFYIVNLEFTDIPNGIYIRQNRCVAPDPYTGMFRFPYTKVSESPYKKCLELLTDKTLDLW
jgi:hypothetical protein